MNHSNNALSTAAIAFLIGIGVLAATTGTATARVVCNSAGDCWHTDQNFKYPRALGVKSYPDDWYFHRDWSHDNDHHYRDYHQGHGYYRGGVWVTF